MKHWFFQPVAPLILTGTSIYSLLDQVNGWRIFGLMAVLLWLGISIRNVLRTRIITSPAGFSSISHQTLETAWSNVEALTIVGADKLLTRTPCLVLRKPVAGTERINLYKAPEHLRGRVIPVMLNMWSNIAQLEQDIQQYAPHVRTDDVWVPTSLTLLEKDQERRTMWLRIAVVAVILLSMYACIAILIARI